MHFNKKMGECFWQKVIFAWLGYRLATIFLTIIDYPNLLTLPSTDNPDPNQSLIEKIVKLEKCFRETSFYQSQEIFLCDKHAVLVGNLFLKCSLQIFFTH